MLISLCNRCDIYEEKTNQELKQLVMGFTRYIEILNKMRRTQTTRQQKAKVIYMGLVARKHVFVACQHQWHKPVCASDQHFCYLLIGKDNI